MMLCRFISRRGKPVEIFCRNVRNFVAASKEVGKFLKQNQEVLLNLTNQESIEVCFSPSYAPHFGGIFEAVINTA